MKTANEAAVLSDILEPKLLPGFSEVESLIDEAIKRGKYSFALSKSLDNRLIVYLQSLGYDVSEDFTRNEATTFISWAKKQ